MNLSIWFADVLLLSWDYRLIPIDGKSTVGPTESSPLPFLDEPVVSNPSDLTDNQHLAASESESCESSRLLLNEILNLISAFKLDFEFLQICWLTFKVYWPIKDTFSKKIPDSMCFWFRTKKNAVEKILLSSKCKYLITLPYSFHYNHMMNFWLDFHAPFTLIVMNVLHMSFCYFCRYSDHDRVI